jgi:hypothetical protein
MAFQSYQQLALDLSEPADDRLEQLLAEESARETADPTYGLLLIQRVTEELGDAA